MGSTPTGRSEDLPGTVRQPAERPSSNLGDCGFDSHSCHSHLGGSAFGRAVVRRAACKAAALRGNVGSIPTRGTEGIRSAELKSKFRNPNSAMRGARSSNGQDTRLSTWRCGFNSRTSRCNVMARSSNGSGRQVLNLWAGVRFPHGSLQCGVRISECGVRTVRFVLHSAIRNPNSAFGTVM